jgi:hypothetical protein
MAQVLTVTDLVRQAIEATIKPLDESTAARLQQHLALQKAIGGKPATSDDLASALKDGWTPDYEVADDAEIQFAGTLTAVQDLQIQGNGAVTLGPATIGVNVGYRTTTTNTGSISGTIRTHRESRSQGVAYALSVLSPVPAPALPAQPAPPAPKP